MGMLDLLTRNMIQNLTIGTSLVAQWLKLFASSARGVGLIPSWGTKIPHAAQHGQPPPSNFTISCPIFNSRTLIFCVLFSFSTPTWAPLRRHPRHPLFAPDSEEVRSWTFKKQLFSNRMLSSPISLTSASAIYTLSWMPDVFAPWLFIKSWFQGSPLFRFTSPPVCSVSDFLSSCNNSERNME